MIEYIIAGAGVVAGIIALTGFKILRPNEMASVETFGKFKKIKTQGITYVLPFFQSFHKVNVAEILVDVKPQEVITKDNLNATVDAQVYYKVKEDDKSVYKALYKAANYENQIVNLAKTTLRNVIGNMMFEDANKNRNEINKKLKATLEKEADAWGIDIVRTEIAEITPPKDVQETMNDILKANNTKVAAKDYAEAKKTEASGFKEAEIQKSEGIKMGKILLAQGDAEAIKLVNDAANKYFIGNAQVLRKIEATEKALKKGTKYVIPDNKSITVVFSDAGGITPIKQGKS